MAKLKAITSKIISKSLDAFNTSGYTTINSSNLKFTAAQRDSNNGRSFSNLYVSFNLPIADEDIIDFDNQFIATTVSGFNQSNIIVAEIPEGQYGELIDGRTIKLVIPILSGGVPTNITCYSSFIVGNNVSSDASDIAQYFGNPVVDGSVYEGPSSNIAFLFSDSIAMPYNNGAGGSWGTTWSAANFPAAFPEGNINYHGFTKGKPSFDIQNDTPIGIAYLDKGFFVLTHPTVVNGFNYTGGTIDGISLYTGASSGFTGLYFSANSTSTYFSFEKHFLLNVNCDALSGEFYLTQNKTAQDLGAYEVSTNVFDMNNVNGVPNPVYITEVGLYDKNGKLIAVGKSDRPIQKRPSDPVSLNLSIKF